jgi:hypothetical protein
MKECWDNTCEQNERTLTATTGARPHTHARTHVQACPHAHANARPPARPPACQKRPPKRPPAAACVRGSCVMTLYPIHPTDISSRHLIIAQISLILSLSETRAQLRQSIGEILYSIRSTSDRTSALEADIITSSSHHHLGDEDSIASIGEASL